MGCEMSPKLEQQQELMSQSSSETSQTVKNPDSAEKKGGHPWFPLMCQRGHFCHSNCSEAF